MANFTAPVTFNSVELDIVNMKPMREQKTRKSVIGKTLVESPVIGIGSHQWNISMTGFITADSYEALGTKRAAIEALFDLIAHSYADGIHDGTFIIRDLNFDDRGDNANMRYEYTIDMVEW